MDLEGNIDNESDENINQTNEILDIKNKIIIIVKFIAIKNAMKMGWKVLITKNKKIIMRKKINKLTYNDNDTIHFLKKIIKTSI